MNNYLQNLNESQREAVVYKDGPMIIIAGAGSGKTRVLTYRIAHLMNQGVDAFNILSLTFTNKAAREMKDRIANVVGVSEAKNLWMGTFHSVFAKILRIESEHIGYPRDFTIYDTQDSKNLIKAIVKEMNAKSVDSLLGTTEIFIFPGYRFKLVDGLITNFHQPGSTLVLLIAAILGEDWKKVYQEALDSNYRFLSYGDSSLLWI